MSICVLLSTAILELAFAFSEACHELIQQLVPCKTVPEHLLSGPVEVVQGPMQDRTPQTKAATENAILCWHPEGNHLK
jgi:hypothetical protein